MKFSEVLSALEAGRLVRRPHWGGAVYVDKTCRMAAARVAGSESPMSMADLLANDWEVVEEPAKAPDKCGFKAREYTCDRESGHGGWHIDGNVSFCPVGSEAGEIPGLHALKMDVARLTRELDEARGDLKLATTCFATTNTPLGPIRCELPRGDEHGTWHVNGARSWGDIDEDEDDDVAGSESR